MEKLTPASFESQAQTAWERHKVRKIGRDTAQTKPKLV